MKKANKLLSLLLSICMLLSMFPAPAVMAADASANTTLTVNEETVNIGETITVSIENPDMNFQGLALKLYFDPELVECTEMLNVEGDDGDDDLFMIYLNSKGKEKEMSPMVGDTIEDTNKDGVFQFAMMPGEDTEFLEGTIVTFTFVAKKAGVVKFELYEECVGQAAFKGTVDSYSVSIFAAAAATYNLFIDGAEADPQEEGADLTEVLGTPAAAEGKVFAGWKFYSDAVNTVEVTLVDNKMPAHDLYAVAQWEDAAVAYTLKILDENGNELDAYTYLDGWDREPAYPNYTKPNYTITWSAAIPDKLTSDVEINAIATPNVYTVDFYNGTEISSEKANEDNNWTVDAPTGLTKAADETNHYIFAGWDTDASADEVAYTGASFAVTGDLNLYAVFTAEGHYGGKATCIAKAVCDKCETSYGEKDAGNHASAEVTYVDNKDGTHTATHTCCDTDIETVAHTFDPNYRCDLCGYEHVFSIVFDYNGGALGNATSNSLGLKSGECLYADDYAWVLECTRERYKLIGWNTKADGSGEALDTSSNIEFVPHDVTYYAQWEAEEYTITFIRPLLNAVLKANEDNNWTITVPDDPSMSGCAFIGWATTENATEADTTYKAGDQVAFTQDMTFYAVFKVQEYTITVNLGSYGTFADGTTKWSITAPAGSKIEYPEYTLKEGYEFDCWKYDNSFTITPTSELPETMPGYDRTYELACKVNLTFKDGDKTETKLMELDTMHRLPVWTKDGYTFQGWSASENGAVLYKVNAVTYVDANIPKTLYAVWQADEYTLTIDMGEHGTIGGNATAEIKAEYASEIAYPEIAVAEGYKLTGWNVTIGENTSTATRLPITLNANATYTAQYELLDVTVNFNEGDTKELSGKYFSKVTAPTLTKTGYTFLGWDDNTNENDTEVLYAGGAEITLNKEVNGKTLYAKWAHNRYLLTLNFNGGINEAGAEYDTISIRYGDAQYWDDINVWGASEREGYTFVGWNSEPDGSGITYDMTTDFVMPDHDVTMYAQWKLNEYTITWDVEGVTSTTTVNHGETPAYEGTPAKAETAQYTYTFAGWTPEVVAATGDVTYTAVFTPVLRSYEITFVVDGVETKVTTNYGEKPVMADPTKASDAEYAYTFAGWTPEVVAVTGEATYTATWNQTPVEYTITFMLDGEIFHEEKGGYGTAVDYSDMPSTDKTGHTFAGWDKVLPATIPAEDIVITGSYTVNNYTITVEGVGDYTFAYGADVTIPTPEAAYGYTFAGWLRDGVAYKLPATMPAEDIVITADWEKIRSIVTVYDENGEMIAGIHFCYQESYQDLAEFIRINILDSYVPEGYTLTGLKYTDGSEVAFPYVHGVEDVDMVLVMVPNEYTITFMNGEETVGTITAPYGSNIEEEVAAIAVTTPEGYEFNCWMVDGKCANLTTMPLNGMTVYADFTVNTYNVNFYATEGDATAHKTIQVEFGTALDVNALLAQVEAPAKEGHSFKGWDTTNVPATMPAEAVDIYGKWDVNSYTITAEGVEYTFAYGEAVSIPVPTKEGHTFIDWDKGIPATMPAENLVLTAKWEKNTYTIFFDVEGYAAISAEYGAEITWPENPTKTGYTFQGWSVDGETVIELPATMPVDGLNLMAVWARNTIYITFNVRGEETVVAFEYEQDIEFPEVDPTYADAQYEYVFAGWSDAPNGASMEITPVATEAKTYYALYEQGAKVQYTATFYMGEESESFSYAWGEEIEEYSYDKEGHTCYWTVNGEKVTFPYTMPTQDVSFVLVATPNTYTITADGQVYTFTYGAEISIAEPAKEGYTFTGWTVQNALGMELAEMPTNMPACDLVLTSKWEINSYMLTIEYCDATGAWQTVEEEVPYGTEIAAFVPETPSFQLFGVTMTFAAWNDGENDITLPEKMGAESLYFTARYVATGWYTDEIGTTYLIESEMIYFNQWVEIEGAQYWFKADGYIAKDITLIDDEYYAFDHDTGKFLGNYTGIYSNIDGDLFYVENGIAVINKGLVRVIENNHIHYYYFGCGANGCTVESCTGIGQYRAQKSIRHWVENNNGYLMKGGFTFDETGAIEHVEDTNRSGIQTIDGVKFYLMDGIKVPYGLIKQGNDYYYARSSGALVVDTTYWVSKDKLNGNDLAPGSYTFDKDGKIVFPEDKNGIYAENDSLYYYVDGVLNYAGLIRYTGDLHNADGTVTKGVYENDWIYVNTQGEVKNNCSYWVSKTNGKMIAMNYTFDENGIMVDAQTSDPEVVKNGVYAENGSLYYYVEGVRTYVGLIRYTGDLNNADGTVTKGIYENDWIYVNSQGEVKNGCSYWISKNNGYMKNGNYTFDENGVMLNPKPL